MNNHQNLINRTLELAKSSVQKGNHPFGALVTLNDKIILEAENEVESNKDITAHAELNLIKKLSFNFSDQEFSKMILYSSTEPCPMCAGAIYWSGIKTVYYACSQKELSCICNIEEAIEAKKILNGDHFKISKISDDKKFSLIHKEFW